MHSSLLLGCERDADHREGIVQERKRRHPVPGAGDSARSEYDTDTVHSLGCLSTNGANSHSGGDRGIIESSFGKSGKFKATFAGGTAQNTDGELVLKYKKYLYNADKHTRKLHQ